jgi:hypothetical protein
MPVFNYTALDAKGYEQTGKVNADNAKEAIHKIRGMGLFPTKVRPAPKQQTLETENSEDHLERNESTAAASEGGFMFPRHSRCKVKHGIETFSGNINIRGEQSGSSLVFKSEPDDFKHQQTVSINLDDIQEVEKKGFLQTACIVKTKTGDEYVFTGNIRRIADVLRFEVDYRNKKS